MSIIEHAVVFPNFTRNMINNGWIQGSVFGAGGLRHVLATGGFAVISAHGHLCHFVLTLGIGSWFPELTALIVRPLLCFLDVLVWVRHAILRLDRMAGIVLLMSLRRNSRRAVFVVKDENSGSSMLGAEILSRL